MIWEKKSFTQQMTRNPTVVCVTILTALMASVSSGAAQFIVGMDTAERYMNQWKENDMYQEIEIRESTARKKYRCDWCDKIIPKGEKYIRQKYIYDGEFCTWRAHCACQRVTDAIWDYADPDCDGLDSDGFYEYGSEICRRFVCPDCPKWNKEYEDCEDDNSLCIDRMDEFFKTHELYRTRKGYYEVWRVREKGQKNETD